MSKSKITSKPQPGRPFQRRRGVILVLVGLMMLVLVGMLGLVIDIGMLMSQTRQLQNVADAAALAAARDLLAGRPSSDAIATAQTYVLQYNGVTAVGGGTVNIPPQSGPYAARVGFAEVLLEENLNTFFIQALPGMDSTHPVSARAVAGYEAVSAGEGVAVLDPTARPGLGVSGGGNIRVNGRVVVNSDGGGLDENGGTVAGTQIAANGGQPNSLDGIFGRDIRIVGGVNDPAKFFNYEADGPSPLKTRQLPEPDPLSNLNVPTTADGLLTTFRGTVNINNNPNLTAPNFVSTTAQTVGPYSVAVGDSVLFPGVYGDIAISAGRTWLMPGVYIMSPQQNSQKGISVTGGTVRGTGVLFYITGKTFAPATGLPDSGDANAVGTLIADMAEFKINGGIADLRPISRNLNGSNSYSYSGQYVDARLDGMLVFQRRASRQSITIAGNADNVGLYGTLYARSANVSVTGQGQYDAQFIVGAMSISGGGRITILSAGGGRGRANQIFLVE